MLFIKKILKYLYQLEEFFIGITLLFVTILIFYNVITRYFFGYSLKFAEELTIYLLIWVTFVGSSVCVKQNKHVGIDAILLKCSPRLNWILQFIILIISFSFSILLFYYGLKITNSVILSKQLSPAMMIPMYIPYLALPIGGFLMAIRYLEGIIIHQKNYNKKEEQDSKC